MQVCALKDVGYGRASKTTGKVGGFAFRTVGKRQRIPNFPRISRESLSRFFHQEISINKIESLQGPLTLDPYFLSAPHTKHDIEVVLGNPKSTIAKSRTVLDVIDSVDLLFSSTFIQDSFLLSLQIRKTHEQQSLRLAKATRRTHNDFTAAQILATSETQFPLLTTHAYLASSGKFIPRLSDSLGKLDIELSAAGSDWNLDKPLFAKQLKNENLPETVLPSNPSRLEGLVGVLRFASSGVALFGLVEVAKALKANDPGAIVFPGFLFLFGLLVASYLHTALKD